MTVGDVLLAVWMVVAWTYATTVLAGLAPAELIRRVLARRRARRARPPAAFWPVDGEIPRFRCAHCDNEAVVTSLELASKARYEWSLDVAVVWERSPDGCRRSSRCTPNPAAPLNASARGMAGEVLQALRPTALWRQALGEAPAPPMGKG